MARRNGDNVGSSKVSARRVVRKAKASKCELRSESTNGKVTGSRSERANGKEKGRGRERDLAPARQK